MSQMNLVPGFVGAGQTKSKLHLHAPVLNQLSTHINIWHTNSKILNKHLILNVSIIVITNLKTALCIKFEKYIFVLNSPNLALIPAFVACEVVSSFGVGMTKTSVNH